MPLMDLSDPKQRADAIARGLIWSAPITAILVAIEDINAGRVPVPAYIPQEWRGFIKVGLPAEQADPQDVPGMQNGGA